MKKYKVLFCDLDGTLIETISGKTFPKGIWDMKFKFDVLDAIKKLTPEYLFIVTNQGGIEKGFVNEDIFINKINYISKCIKEYCNIPVVDFYYCISNDSNNYRRKPHVGMLFQAIKNVHFPATKDDMLMIGDASGLEGQFSDSDKKTAENFGIYYIDVNKFVNIMTVQNFIDSQEEMPSDIANTVNEHFTELL